MRAETTALAVALRCRHNRGMSTAARTLRRYDHRLKELVRATGNLSLALECGVPRSTAYGWLKHSQTDVISLDVHDAEAADLQREVVRLRRRNARLAALLRLIMTVVKVAGFSLVGVRLPQESDKRRVLRAIEQARVHFSLRTVLRIIGLTHGRYHAWSADQCGLEDLESCPKSSPQQLTPAEVSTIREIVTSDEFRHVPTGTLARLAQRLGKVFASGIASCGSTDGDGLANACIRPNRRLAFEQPGQTRSGTSTRPFSVYSTAAASFFTP